MAPRNQKNHSGDEEELHVAWPKYVPGKGKRNIAQQKQILSLVWMINEKFRERLPAWQIIELTPEHFSHFFSEVLGLLLDEGPPFSQQIEMVTFLNNAFNSLEVEFVRQEVGRLCSLPIWANLLPSQRNHLLDQNPKLKKYWQKMEQKLKQLPEEEFTKLDFNRRLLWRLLQRLKRTVDFIDDESKELDIDAVGYCERLLALFIDLEAQLTTRRFFNALLLSSHVLTHCFLSQLIRVEHGSLFCELLTMLKFYARFEIDDVTGQQLTQAEVTKNHYDFVSQLQKAVFKFLNAKMPEFCLLPVGSVDSAKFLRKELSNLERDELYQIGEYLRLVPPANEHHNGQEEENALDINYARLEEAEYLREMVVFICERRPSQLQRLNQEPLYPTEHVIWDEKMVPYEHFDGKSVLPLNKLNLQFLTLHDYLLRNFNLFRMESTYEIRQDIEDVLYRMKPWRHEHDDQEVVWGGWAKMALPIAGSRIVQVGKPLVGETAPSEVRADVQIALPGRSDLRDDWLSLRKNDVLFLLKVRPTQKVGHRFDVRQPFKSQFDVTHIRGCEVEGILGPDGRVLDEMENRDVVRKMPGDARSYRIRFDPNQYKEDTDKGVETEVYFSFNLIIRRDPKTNNFRSVLGTIRQLLNTECVVPEWLHDLILGYGEPETAHYSRMQNTVASVDFNDTFLSYEHLLKSFPEKKVVCNEKEPTPPFRLTFNEFVPQHNIEDPSQRDASIVVENQKAFNRVLTETFQKNSIEFTPAQVEAIKSGMQPGLTMVVGPPGTGKTDVAVQIISNIYHNWPEQRTLIVTHSNQALNQIFEKIIRLDVDERHLLRMGHGEEELETEKDFSRYGRVNYVLKERQRLLDRVEMLRDSMQEAGDVAYSCETAGYFFRYTVCKTWEHFLELVEREKKKKKKQGEDNDGSTLPTADFIADNFPFSRFFEMRSQQNSMPLKFKQESFDDDLHTAMEGWTIITDIFKKLEEFRAFELLRNGKDRANYLLVKESKIIAMTCTHAALRRRELVDLGFRYDNILMEEAAQILEVETFIPLLLQDPQDGRSRLKRWIMIGDHHQLPPIVQNIAYQKFSNMEQSLFARLIRLGVPHVNLDAQGRARSELAALYNWRYHRLGDLPHVQALPEFRVQNAGFLHNFQLIDVPDFNGVGESTPSPHFFQNLGEAEYAVALFVYMRILGYPANKISILTTYNGQTSLLQDIVQKRCSNNPLIGTPAKISTVDRYQGQQNDYIILSLVRTKAIGHLRDVRRLVVALSRARLGLYILCRVSLFSRCYELFPAFQRLLQKPTRLQLLPSEQYPQENERPADQMEPIEIVDTQHMSHFVSEFYKSNLDFLQQRSMAGLEAEFRDVEMEEEAEATTQMMDTQQQEQVVPSTGANVAGEGTSEEAAVADAPQHGPKEKDEGAIVFEQVDFERLQEMPKY